MGGECVRDGEKESEIDKECVRERGRVTESVCEGEGEGVRKGEKGRQIIRQKLNN